MVENASLKRHFKFANKLREKNKFYLACFWPRLLNIFIIIYQQKVSTGLGVKKALYSNSSTTKIVNKQRKQINRYWPTSRISQLKLSSFTTVCSPLYLIQNQELIFMMLNWLKVMFQAHLWSRMTLPVILSTSWKDENKPTKMAWLRLGFPNFEILSTCIWHTPVDFLPL